MAYKLWTLSEPGIGSADNFDSWWDLIAWIADNDRINMLTFNQNDTTRVAEYHWNGETQYKEYKTYWRNVMVTDDFDRIIPPSEIRAAVKEYKPKTEKERSGVRRYLGIYFDFRRDPVPWTSHHCGLYYHYPKHCYKNTWVKATGTTTARERLDSVRQYDGYPRSQERNWKRYRKTQYKA